MDVHRSTSGLILFLLATAACGFEGQLPPEDDATDPGGGNPGGGNPGGGSNANPDQDSDGVPDSSDNCRTIINPRQYDEDADAVGDACDNCPHVANAGQENVAETNAGNNADTVGDVCDPRPTGEGDSIAMFVGFHEAADFNGWQVAGDQNFAVVGGVLRNTTTTDLALAWRNNANLRDATLVTKVKYTSLSTTYQWKGFAIVGNFVRTPNLPNRLGSGAGCGEMRDTNFLANSARYNAAEYQGDNFNNDLSSNSAGPLLAPQQTSVYEATLSDDEVRCRKGTATWARSVTRRDNGIALSAWGAGVDIEYVVAFKTAGD